MKKIGMFFWGLSLLLCFLMGCSIEDTDSHKIKDLDFTVVEPKELPTELGDVIATKKQNEFKLTFTDKEFLYIVIGYGTKETGGYSISVEELYLTSNAIYIDTNLIGPSKDEKLGVVKSMPYVVIKTQYMDKSVVFN